MTRGEVCDYFSSFRPSCLSFFSSFLLLDELGLRVFSVVSVV